VTLQRYLVEEIALDHAEGLLSRREALRRMAMMGVGAVAASGFLAACSIGDSKTNPPTSATPGSSSPPSSAWSGSASGEQ
jgi:carboxymethylenebutenolidase